jgi:hypothetical protein
MGVPIFPRRYALLDSNSLVITNVPGHLESFARRQIEQALTAFADRCGSVHLSMTELKDQMSRVSCRIRVRLIPSGIWLIQESRDAHPKLALERAAMALRRFFESRRNRLSQERALIAAA